MDLWVWILIGVAVFIVLAVLTKGKIFGILGDIFDAFD